MKIEVFNEVINIEAGGLIAYLEKDKPAFLNTKIKSTIIKTLINEFKIRAICELEKDNAIELYIKSSNTCNLSCSYCFRIPNEENINLNIVDKFIRNIVNKSKSKKIKIDLTGDSEPLADIDTLQSIINTCNKIGQEKNVEFVYALNSNGTIMNEDILNFLYKNSILFGFTVEGFSLNNYERLYKNGKPSQNDVLKNIYKYKLNENKLFGTSMTLTSKHLDFVKEYKKLSSISNAVSMRIVNTFDELGVTSENINDWKEKYKKLANYLLRKIDNKEYEKILPIVRSRDFFGELITICLFNVKKMQKCSAGYNQVFLDYNGSIYICAWGRGNAKFEIGRNCTVDSEKHNYYKTKTVDDIPRCSECDIRYFCGGECHIILEQNRELDSWCDLKKYLFSLAFYIVDYLKKKDLNGYLFIKKTFEINKFSDTIEPYILTLIEIYKMKGLKISPNTIKNEIYSLEKGPSVDNFINYLKNKNIRVSLIDKNEIIKTKDRLIIHHQKNEYNYYSLMNNYTFEKKLENNTDFNIIRIY